MIGCRYPHRKEKFVDIYGDVFYLDRRVALNCKNILVVPDGLGVIPQGVELLAFFEVIEKLLR